MLEGLLHLPEAAIVGSFVAVTLIGWLVAVSAMRAGCSWRGRVVWMYAALVVALLSAAALLNYTWTRVGDLVHFILWLGMLMPLGFIFWCGISPPKHSSKIST
jgi:hypothetical protein